MRNLVTMTDTKRNIITAGICATLLLVGASAGVQYAAEASNEIPVGVATMTVTPDGPVSSSITNGTISGSGGSLSGEGSTSGGNIEGNTSGN